jgi:hypothetical protein
MQDGAPTPIATDFQVWRENALSSQPGWETRAQAISHFIRPTDVVLDLGAGDQKLRKYLPAACRYLPVDCVGERANTFVVDFNKEFRLPEDDFNVIVSAGFLEYIADLPQFMSRLATACPGRLFIFTYHYAGQPKQKSHQYRKLNALRDARECLSFFGSYIDDLHEVLSFKTQGLFIGTISPDAKPRLGVVPTINIALAPSKRWPRWWPRGVGRLLSALASRGIAKHGA